jgi:hypothetical protein
MSFSTEVCAELTQLEEDMWREGTRYDLAFQERRFATDFVEFGRSGQVYTREQVISTNPQQILAVLPLPNLPPKSPTTVRSPMPVPSNTPTVAQSGRASMESGSCASIKEPRMCRARSLSLRTPRFTADQPAPETIPMTTG